MEAIEKAVAGEAFADENRLRSRMNRPQTTSTIQKDCPPEWLKKHNEKWAKSDGSSSTPAAAAA